MLKCVVEWSGQCLLFYSPDLPGQELILVSLRGIKQLHASR